MSGYVVLCERAPTAYLSAHPHLISRVSFPKEKIKKKIFLIKAINRKNILSAIVALEHHPNIWSKWSMAK